eukprot:6202859-Pleurochrysis_carterae.AAC.1
MSQRHEASDVRTVSPAKGSLRPERGVGRDSAYAASRSGETSHVGTAGGYAGLISGEGTACSA